MSITSYASLVVLSGNVGIVAAALFGLNRALQAADWLDAERRRAVAFAAMTLIGWLGAAIVLSWNEVFRGFSDRIPTIQYGIFGPILIGVVLYWRSATVRRAIDAIPQDWLVGIQFYRVLGMIFLVLLGAGLLPAVFALPAGSGDVLVGLLAMVVAAVYRSGGESRNAWIGGWNAFGLADLAVAVATGFMTSPSALQTLSFDAPNDMISVFPLALIPVFAVPLSVLLHLASLANLRRAATVSAMFPATA